MTLRCLVIADDFTGANDTGVQMKKRGLPVRVNINPHKVERELSVVLDTETRNSKPDVAYDKVKRMFTSQLNKEAFDLVYKKMDSTLRGNVLEEIEAAVEVYQPDKIIFAPAHPEIGRTTRHGVHLLNDVPLMESEFAEDPLSPIKMDNIIHLMSQLFEGQVKHHLVSDVLSQNISLDDARCHTFDCDSHTCLLNISEAVLREKKKVLWVGSAGLAHALFETLIPSKPALSVLGSISEVTLNQLRYAESKQVPVYKIDITDALNKERNDQMIQEITEKLKDNQDVILTAARTREDYKETIKYAAERGVSKDGCSWHIQNVLADMTRKLVESCSVSGVFLTGGATAISVMDALEASSVLVQDELLTGMVRSKLADGPFKELTIITKAGSFGRKDDLVYAIKKLKEV